MTAYATKVLPVLNFLHTNNIYCLIYKTILQVV